MEEELDVGDFYVPVRQDVASKMKVDGGEGYIRWINHKVNEFLKTSDKTMDQPYQESEASKYAKFALLQTYSFHDTRATEYPNFFDIFLEPAPLASLFVPPQLNVRGKVKSQKETVPSKHDFDERDDDEEFEEEEVEMIMSVKARL